MAKTCEVLIKNNGVETERDDQFRDKASGSYHGNSPLETGSPFWDPGISAKPKPNKVCFTGCGEVSSSNKLNEN